MPWRQEDAEAALTLGCFRTGRFWDGARRGLIASAALLRCFGGRWLSLLYDRPFTTPILDRVLATWSAAHKKQHSFARERVLQGIDGRPTERSLACRVRPPWPWLVPSGSTLVLPQMVGGTHCAEKGLCKDRE